MLGGEEALPVAIQAEFAPRNAFPNQVVTHLDLTNNHFDAAGLSCLADALSHLHQLSVLRLNRNDVGSEPSSIAAMTALAGRLGSEVKTLALASCSMTPVEATAVCENLMGHPALELLDLSDNCLGFICGSGQMTRERQNTRDINSGLPHPSSLKSGRTGGATSFVPSSVATKTHGADSTESSAASNSSNFAFIHSLDALVREGTPHLRMVNLALNGISDGFGLQYLLRNGASIPEIGSDIDLAANALSEELRESLIQIMPTARDYKARRMTKLWDSLRGVRQSLPNKDPSRAPPPSTSLKKRRIDE